MDEFVWGGFDQNLNVHPDQTKALREAPIIPNLQHLSMYEEASVLQTVTSNLCAFYELE